MRVADKAKMMPMIAAPHQAKARSRLILSRYGHLLLQVESVPGVFSGALGDMGYIFRSPGLDQVMEVVRFIHETSA